MKTKVVGLDISANRIAYAICDSVTFFGASVYKRDRSDFMHRWVRYVGQLIREEAYSLDGPYAYCLEINLHPKVIHKGHVAPNMIRAYMRSRWLEGSLMGQLTFEEPWEGVRLRDGGIHVARGKHIYALPASWTKRAKETRRRRMQAIYGAHIDRASEDEVDALAIAHDCAVGLILAETGVYDAKAE